MDYTYTDEPPLHRGHRHARDAALAESTRSWTKAMYKHEEAATSFTECLGLTSHPQANKAILLLIAKHRQRFEAIRDKLASTKSMKNMLAQSGYPLYATNLNSINDGIYHELREQMQQIVSFSHQKIIAIAPQQPTAPQQPVSVDTGDKQTQMDEYLQKCDVRKSVNISADTAATRNTSASSRKKASNRDDSSSSVSINRERVVVNDNFFNPNHEQQSKQELSAHNQALLQRVKLLESQLSRQSEALQQYQHTMSAKVSTLRQRLDHLYNVNHPNRAQSSKTSKKGASSSSADAQNIDADHALHGGDKSSGDAASDRQKRLAANSKEVQQLIVDKVEEEKTRWQADKERVRTIHAKQLQELKKKIKDWMDYAKKQEQHAKVYKKQLQIQHNNAKTSAAGVANRGARGTLSRATKNVIPESQET